MDTFGAVRLDGNSVTAHFTGLIFYAISLVCFFLQEGVDKLYVYG